uniref:Uncharacterized protein n=1 Tax=Oryza rufipogon TaxID=4529 RepID=A0A0G2KBR4_ORYRU
MMKSPLYLTF